MLNILHNPGEVIQDERLKPLNSQPVRQGQYVVYWMQSSQRTEINHALEYAILKANELSQPLIVFFGLTGNFPEGNARHYHFMLQGLREVRISLKERRIFMVIQAIDPPAGIAVLAKKASMVVVDRGYLRTQRDWRYEAAMNIECSLVQVESDIIVPVEEASGKEEFSAATLRSKLKRQFIKYLKPLDQYEVKLSSLNMDFDSIHLEDFDQVISGLKVDQSANPVTIYQGGTSQANKHLEKFLQSCLHRYSEEHHDPNSDVQSNLSAYLHFGQISSLHIALKALEHAGPGSESFLEELIIRRELAINFVFYNPAYYTFAGLPDWSKKSLIVHSEDAREVTYSVSQFENASTHDKYWNAAQREMLLTGKMHGYMRMYWGKKILEWSESPAVAFKTALYLNNKYELDGREPNGFAGVSWCFGKHDRPWPVRPVFGNIRYMNAGGLKRKFDADQYADKFKELNPQSPPPI
jgi:deoxyribodipyrimidine photo-lyase